ncbi:hypothetical protein [Sphingomicrobium aestuariivivum]|uniref:hypothetical protein n=1 Tax=Sphingomicrobium aestuariivivum TaxID=1582356 RepID=UPI001FD64FE7|nr:hypothetical protein [Sphingomicrobium aestuariivivum]MCJ8190236.1 hypothetical protein [Sphingomicrobium aestuariivivum]
MTRRGILGAGVGTLFAALGACNIFRSPSYRFRLTVNVDTPDGIRTGSSICEVKADRGTDLSTGGQTQGVKMRGEAAIVELPDDRLLVALLLTNNPLLRDVGKASLRTLDGGFDGKKYNSAKRIEDAGSIGPVDMPEPDLPVLVTFEDPTDPESLKVVDPSDLASTFGAGYSLESITMETTQDRVTDHVPEFFPWLPAIPGSLLPSTTIYSSEKPLAEKIRPPHFQLTGFDSLWLN